MDLLPLLGRKSDRHTAIIIEEPGSYVGREVRRVQYFCYFCFLFERSSRGSHFVFLSACLSGSQVILDLQQYSGVEVKRAMSSDRPLLDALKITAFPSIYLLHPNGTHSQLHV